MKEEESYVKKNQEHKNVFHYKICFTKMYKTSVMACFASVMANHCISDYSPKSIPIFLIIFAGFGPGI